MDGNEKEYNPYMPDPTTSGILGAFDATDIIEEIRYNIRRYELTENKDGKKEWVPPRQEFKTFQITKEKINETWGNIENFLEYLNDRGGKIESETEEIIVFNDVVGEPTKPLVNRIGEHDLMSLLTSFLTRNIKLSSFPGKDQDNFVYKMTAYFAHDLINILGVNANKYEIQEPKHISVIMWIIIPNVFAALQTPVEAGGRMTLEKILGETKVVREVLSPGLEG